MKSAAINKKKPVAAPTIDEIHTGQLNHFFTQKSTVLPRLINERKDAIKRLTAITCESYNDSNEVLDESHRLTQRIKQLNVDINKIKNEKQRYLLNNSKDIFHYFKDKQQVSMGHNKKNKDVLNIFFNIQNSATEPISTNSYSDLKRSYDGFWKYVNNDNTTTKNIAYDTNICDVCGRGEMIPQDDEGILICNNTTCGIYIPHIVDNNKPTNKEPPAEVSYTAYIKLNHFKEILFQFQAKETTHIPPEVMTAITNRIKKERIPCPEGINYKVMREILRNLELNRYFEHIQYINSLLGVTPPLMDDKLMETLCVLFIEIHRPWALYCPPERINFFNYTYILYQLCVLLDQTHYLPYIQLLKNPALQKQQDDIWKKVCHDLDWQFFPTV
jgi:hypothetical protein